MQILAFGDIHMATSSLSSIEGISAADLLIVTGDLTNYGDKADAKEVLNHILSYNKNLLSLAGNMDNSDINDYLEELGMNIHGQAHLVKRKVCIFGVGGSNRTPFDTPWEFSEDQLYRLIMEAYHQAIELMEIAEPIAGHPIPAIFVSHVPPIGSSLDTNRKGEHAGSKAVRNFIENHHPALCLSGHVHHGRGEEQIGETHVVNPGPLLDGGWVKIEVDRTRLLATLH